MNAVRAIRPYRHQGLWDFDVETVGLRQEPSVSGADGNLSGRYQTPLTCSPLIPEE